MEEAQTEGKRSVVRGNQQQKERENLSAGQAKRTRKEGKIIEIKMEGKAEWTNERWWAAETLRR